MSKPTTDGPIDSVGTAETMFDVVQRLNESDGEPLSELAADLEYAKSTVHRHLRTLENLGYVVRRDDGYHVGLRFLELGVAARNEVRGYDLVRAKVEELAEETGERAQFFVEEHAMAVYLTRSAGKQAVRTDPGIGSRVPMYATAAGKSILAELPERKLSDMFERMSFDPVTEHTITDPAELRAEIETVRERGYSFNREESLTGTNAAGVPICGPDGDVIGALSVTGPSHRLSGELLETELPDLLLGAANELELNIAHS